MSFEISFVTRCLLTAISGTYLRFPLDYPKHPHIEHILTQQQTPPFFPRMVIYIKTGCDVTDKRYGPLIQPWLGGG